MSCWTRLVLLCLTVDPTFSHLYVYCDLDLLEDYRHPVARVAVERRVLLPDPWIYPSSRCLIFTFLLHL